MVAREEIGAPGKMRIPERGLEEQIPRSETSTNQR